MQKNIDIVEAILTKLKLITVFENNSVKGLMVEAVLWLVAQNKKQRLDNLTQEEKEDLGLLFLMQQADRTDLARREEVMEILNKK